MNGIQIPQVEPSPPRRVIGIPISTLGATETVDFNLFLRHDRKSAPLLYREKSYPITGEDLERFIQQGQKFLFIDEDDYPKYQRYLRENLAQVLIDSSRPVARRYEFLSELARDSIRHAFERDNIDLVMTEAQGLAVEMAKLAVSQDLLVYDLFSLLRHDYSNFTHAFNVGSYALVLARALGQTDEDELAQIAVGGLLHDIGMLAVPTTVLTRRGPLTDIERNIVRQHPHDGFERLCRRPEMSWGQLMMVYQHHERIDGHGYPVGISGDEIHPWAKMCAVVNAFDSKTSSRPYQIVLSPQEAMQFIEQEAGMHFDTEMVRCWKSLQRASNG